MARYPKNYQQSITPEDLAALPEFAVYEGDDPALQHLIGTVIRTVDVEKVVFVGERENVWVARDGERWRPWAGVMILELDEAGNPVIPPIEPITERGPRAMSIGDLGALGLTDQMLADLAKRALGVDWTPDRPGPSDARRDMFDRVMKAMEG